METLNYDENFWKQKPCPPVDCRKKSCKCGLKKVFLASVLGDDSPESPIAPKNGAYCNAIVAYEATGNIYIYSQEGIPTLVETDVEDLKKGLAREILDRRAADGVLQEEIDAIKNSPDVVDIVATYAALQAYDTQHLGDNDVIRVLADETHDGQSTYYRWNKQGDAWVYIGAVGDYYTKGQVDTLLGGKQDKLTAGANITIDANNEISATDTTYSNFTGTDGVDPGTAGLVPAPATTDADKFLKSDGTWAEAGGGGITALTTADYNYPANSPNGLAPWLLDPGLYYTTESMNIYSNSGSSSSSGSNAFYVAKTWNGAKSVLRLVNDSWSYTDYTSAGASSTSYSLLGTNKIQQTTGTSTYEVMSQKAVTDTLFYNNDTTKVQIGSNASATGGTYFSAVAIGQNAKATGSSSTAITNSTASGDSTVAIGRANATAQGAIGIGYGITATGKGAVAIGGYNGSSTAALAQYDGAVAIGMGSRCTSVGEFNIGDRSSTYGYNNSAYRLLSGLYDGQTAHDAATVGQALGETESYTIATSDWSTLSASSPYTYQATVTATHTIGASTIAELINDAPVTFATYGFAIGSISGQSVTIYSIGQPSTSVTLKVNYKG